MSDLDRLTVHQLKVLAVLLDTRSVSASARRLRVSQPAVSHSLRTLRECLGDPLLVPGSRGMVATPRAEVLAPALRRLLRDVETTLGEVPTFDPATMRRLFVLGTWDGISVTLLPRLLARIGAEAPGVDLDLRPVGRAGSARELEDGVVDLTIEVRPAESPGLKQRALARDHLVCVVRADHPEVGETLDLETYLRLPHALISPQGDGPGAVDTLLLARGLSRRVALRIRYFLAAPLIVAESDLVLTAPASVARAFARMAPLRLLAPPIDIPSYTTSMVWHERSDGDPGHAWLREAVVTGMAVEPG